MISANPNVPSVMSGKKSICSSVPSTHQYGKWKDGQLDGECWCMSRMVTDFKRWSAFEYKTKIYPLNQLHEHCVFIIKVISMVIITIIPIIIEKPSLWAILGIGESEIVTNCDQFTTSPYLEPSVISRQQRRRHKAKEKYSKLEELMFIFWQNKKFLLKR